MAGQRDEVRSEAAVRAADGASGGSGDAPLSVAVREARAAMASGDLGRARDLLAARVARRRDPDALRLLGEVLHELGDLPAAGAAWFATSAKGPMVDEAVSAWRAHHHDDFARMWRSIPPTARQEPLTPKLSALRAKAEASVSLDRRAAYAPTPAASSTPTASSTSTSAAAVSRPSVTSHSTHSKPEQPEPTTSESTRPQPGRSTRPGSASGSSTLGSTESADEVAELPDERSDGFDAAKVIAWILAAFFVVCAVVGLVTILQWIVPGA
jgi:hypothetical protein